MFNAKFKRFEDAVGGIYDRADYAVSRLRRRPLSPLVMFLAILVSDGSLAAILDGLPQDLANGTVPTPEDDEIIDQRS